MIVPCVPRGSSPLNRKFAKILEIQTEKSGEPARRRTSVLSDPLRPHVHETRNGQCRRVRFNALTIPCHMIQYMKKIKVCLNFRRSPVTIGCAEPVAGPVEASAAGSRTISRCPRRSISCPVTREFLMPPQWFFTGNDGKRVGPYSPQQLKQMASNGELTSAGGPCAQVRYQVVKALPLPKRPH